MRTSAIMAAFRFTSFHGYRLLRYKFFRQNVISTRNWSTSTPGNFSEFCTEDLKEMRRSSMLREESQDRTIVDNVKEPYVKFSHHLRSMVDFTSMDHLGFGSNSDVLNAHNKALLEDSLSGRRDYKIGLKLELEAEIADFHQRPACIFYNHVPDVKRKLLLALNSADDVIFYDEFNENSSYIMSSCVAQTVQFSHKNIEDLITQLHTHKNKRHKMILLDCAFPFMGMATPVREIAKVAEDHECLFVTDDTYGVGVIGNQLRGAEQLLPYKQRPFLLTNSFGRSIGINTCGYLVGPAALVEHISKLNVMDDHLDIPAPVMAVALKIFSLLKKMETEKASQNVLAMSNHIRQNLDAAGYRVDNCNLPMVSFHVGKETLLDEFADQLQDSGILCTVSKYPQVPKGESRLGLSVSVHHTPELIDSALQKILKVGSRLKVPRQ